MDSDFFDELSRLQRGTGSDPQAYKRLGRALEAGSVELHAYFREVGRDYVERLERRLSKPGAKLSEEERALVRAWTGIAAFDGDREQALLDDLAALDDVMEEIDELRDSPLQATLVEQLRGLLGDAARLVSKIGSDLEAQQAWRRLEAELGDGGATMNREALLARLRAGLSS